MHSVFEKKLKTLNIRLFSHSWSLKFHTFFLEWLILTSRLLKKNLKPVAGNLDYL